MFIFSQDRMQSVDASLINVFFVDEHNTVYVYLQGADDRLQLGRYETVDMAMNAVDGAASAKIAGDASYYMPVDDVVAD